MLSLVWVQDLHVAVAQYLFGEKLPLAIPAAAAAGMIQVDRPLVHIIRLEFMASAHMLVLSPRDLCISGMCAEWCCRLHKEVGRRELRSRRRKRSVYKVL